MANDTRSGRPARRDVLHLTVLTPERGVLDQDVYSVTVPGAQGYLGILKDHAPLISSTVPGKLTVKDVGGNPSVYAVGAGFVEVSDNKVSILADSFIPAGEINAGEATASRDAARKRLEQQNLTPAQKSEAQELLADAGNLLYVKRNPGPSV